MATFHYLKQLLKIPLRPLYRRLVRRLEAGVRAECAAELREHAQQLAALRTAQDSFPQKLVAEVDALAREAVKVWISNGLEAEMSKVLREVHKFEDLVRAELTRTAHLYAAHHLELAQQVADEIMRMNQKLEGLTQEADQILTMPETLALAQVA